MLHNIIIRHKYQQSMPLAIFTMEMELHGFLFLCVHIVLFLWYGALLSSPLGHNNSAIPLTE